MALDWYAVAAQLAGAVAAAAAQPAEKGLVDWFTVGAQALNFLVLVVLLKRFLYGPIVKAMAEREARVAAALGDAQAREAQAAQEAERLRSQQAALQGQREALLAEAGAQAEGLKQEELAQSRKALQALESRWREAVAHEREGFLREARARLAHQALAVARQVTRELADAALEDRILEVFVRRLVALPEDERRALAAALAASGEPLVVATSFPRDEGWRRRLEEAVRARLGPVALHWEVSPELWGGVTLTAGGRRLGWNIKDYLDGLDERLAEALVTEDAHDRQHPAAAAPERRDGA